jgi:hypothetical protein
VVGGGWEVRAWRVHGDGVLCTAAQDEAEQSGAEAAARAGGGEGVEG